MKRKMLLIAVIGIVFIVGVIAYLSLFTRTRQIGNMEEQAGYLIKKVEEYKRQHHQLPKYIDDMQLNLPDDYPFSYALTKDSSNYLVGFEIAPFKSMVYYSENKTWMSQQ
ncbi:hypothetical protein [Mucilaginibacter rubeus]|uniref:DUF3139 domain-containing protein n=1 Tax=Mucilaginibacter rubeus TaxID=2027860 RepID=A0A5C1I4Q5_9SPHI|nr:hypothetical protein [Mucilaginibacter rubeus]QEM12943.1 hypothetical protein DEO27_024005 [Mucilaginibacter rubeus]